MNHNLKCAIVSIMAIAGLPSAALAADLSYTCVNTATNAGFTKSATTVFVTQDPSNNAWAIIQLRQIRSYYNPLVLD